MTPVRSLFFAVVVTSFAATGASAQVFVDPSGQAPPPMMPMAHPPASAQQECVKFVPLRQETEKRASTLKAAIDRKVDRAELCKLFKSYSSAENSMLKFMVDQQATCGIPANVLDQVKTSRTRTAQLTRQVCSTAAAPSAPPPPSLSEALGTARVPAATSRANSGGTFNTLTGAPLAR